MKISLPYRGAGRFIPESPEMNFQSLKLMFGFNSVFLGISFFLLVFHIVTGAANDYFVVDLLAFFIFLLTFLSILNGKVNYALNAVFLIPVLIYVSFLSDFVDHEPASETFGKSLWIVSVTLGYLTLFSVSIRRIVVFYVTSFATLLIHISIGGLLQDFLKLNQKFASNPLIIFSVVFLVLLLVRGLYQRQINKISGDLSGLQQNIKELFNAIRFPAIHVRLIRNSSGNDILITERINTTFESVFGVRALEVAGQEAVTVFSRSFSGSISPVNLLLSEITRREIYLENLERWYTIHVLKPDQRNFYAVFSDITNEKNKLYELEESKQRFRVLLEAIPDIFFIIGKDGIYEDILIKEEDKDKFQDLEVIGKSIFEIGFSKRMADRIYDCIQHAIENFNTETIEYELVVHDYGRLVFEMRIARLNERSVITIARDITNRKMAEFNLIEAKEKVEELAKLKSVFLGSLSQNIRTPVNIILAFSKILCEKEPTGTSPEFLIKGISENSHLLLKMIDDTINLSKIETDTVEQKPGHVRINLLIKNLYAHFIEILPEGKNLKLEVHTEVESNDFGFYTDHNLLFEAMKKLLDNAVKFSKEGVIYFGYHLRPSTNAIEFFVEDQGTGIQKEEQKYIFEKFYVGKNHRADVNCPGLGLSIAQHFVALLGGELKVDSVFGKGSRFYFHLTLREGKGYLRIVS